MTKAKAREIVRACGHGARLTVLGLATALTLVAAGPPSIARDAHATAAKIDSADRLIFWLGCEKVVGLTNAELDMWKHRGVDGFACMAGHLRGMGGTQDFTGKAGLSLSAGKYRLQRALRASKIVRRARARGMKMYLGADLANYWNSATPLSDWFNDAGWSHLVVPDLRHMAAAARRLGFAGLAFDQELYPQQGGATSATWSWDYPGNTRPEAEVRAKARQRGRELMNAIVARFPGAEIMAHGVEFPHSWSELVQLQVNGDQNAFASRLDIDFWDGLLSVKGYSAIRLADATFYKTPHLGTWNNALKYNANRLASLFSHRLSNWRYASSRLFVSPSSWIDPGPSSGPFDDARPPAYVKQQLLAFRKWGMGGEFANYVYGDLHTFDYSPYAGAMEEASTPAAVDSVDPTLTVRTQINSSGPPPLIKGTAHDNLAVWAVRWHDDRGGSGVAELNWVVRAGDDMSGYDPKTHWSFPVSDLAAGARTITIIAEDIKGNRSAPATLRVAR